MKSELLLKWREQVVHNSNQCAIKYEDKEYTYFELDKIVKQIEFMLYNKKITEEKLIGVYLKPSLKYVASILAILNMGYAFVPLDSEWPEDRINYVIVQCNINIVITDDIDFLEKFNFKHSIFLSQNISDIGFKFKNTTNPTLNIKNDDLAYIMFTSGTSGEPKGVMIEHGAISNLAKWFGKKYDISNKTNVAMMTNVSFDVSIEEIFGTLLNGACLVIPNYIQKVNSKHFFNFVTDNNINLVEFVPRTLRELIANNNTMNTLSTLICGAEPLDQELMNLVLEKGYELYNNYGPTENTVDTTSWKCELNQNVSLGSPIDNVSCFLLSDNQKIIKQEGIIGELCIKGVQLSKGYYNNDSENKKHFGTLSNGERYYRTGDLAWLKDKKYYYVGRKDSQIKVNGKRIELEEIVSLLKKVRGIDQIYVEVINFNNKKNICVFWNGSATKDELIMYLNDKVPKYMMPNLWVKCEQFIYNTNGKVDFLKILEKHEDNNILTSTINDIELELIEFMEKQIQQTDLTFKINSTISELNIDSLEFVSLIIAFEEKYNCDLNDQLIMNYNEKVIEFIDRIASKISR